MRQYFMATVSTEVLKVRKSKMVWLTLAIFTIAPLMAGFFMYILKDPELARKSGLLGAQAQLYGDATWETHLTFLTQIIAVGGIIVFGFVTSWIFGREYTDRTVKDIIALPFPRIYIILAKYITTVIVCLLLTIYITIVGLLIGWIIEIPEWSSAVFFPGLWEILVVTTFTILLSTPVAFFACYGKGFLAPLGFVILMVVFSQIIGAIGYGKYFPWAIPALYSGISGVESTLTITSVTIIVVTSFLGVIATFVWWNVADQQ